MKAREKKVYGREREDRALAPKGKILDELYLMVEGGVGRRGGGGVGGA
jgi:hypothetical protein